MPIAVILSLGMLNQTVDTNKFIEPLLMKAKVKNTSFDLTPTLQTEAFKFSTQFNKGEITPETFKKNILELFKLNIEENEFWDLWNSMVKVGNVKTKFDELNAFAAGKDLLIYFHTDTNAVHLEQVMKNQYQANGVTLDLTSQPAKLGEFSLYPSYQLGKDRFELVQLLKAKIDEKEFNKPEKIILVLGDPKNIDAPQHRQKAEQDTQQIQLWANTNGVSVVLHQKAENLINTINLALKPSQQMPSTPVPRI